MLILLLSVGVAGAMNSKKEVDRMAQGTESKIFYIVALKKIGNFLSGSIKNVRDLIIDSHEDNADLVRSLKASLLDEKVLK